MLEGGTGNDTLTGDRGNDLFDGGDGVDFVDYSGATSALMVDLALADGMTMQFVGGNQGYDRFIDIEGVIGSAFDDILSGSAGDDIFFGGDGNDRYVASGGDDILQVGSGQDSFWIGIDFEIVSVELMDADADGTVDDLVFTLVETDTGVIATTTVIDHLSAPLYEMQWYENGSPVTVRVATDYLPTFDNMAYAGTAGADIIDAGDGKDYLIGNAGNDELYGGADEDVLIGGLGDDLIDGGLGSTEGGFDIDTVDYYDAPGAVVVNLATGTASDGSGGTDTLVDIERVDGSRFDDSLTGDAENNHLMGNDGDDVLAGGGGSDLLEGGDGIDIAAYTGVGSGYQVDMGDGGFTVLDVDPADGDEGIDQIDGIEVLRFSDGDFAIGYDEMMQVTLTGDAADNSIRVGNGIALVDGGAGDDLIIGGDSDATLSGGTGNDVLIGNGGADILVGDAPNGSGADTFRYVSKFDSTVATMDSIVGFESGVDSIEFEGMAGIRFGGVYPGGIPAATVSAIVADGSITDRAVFFTDGENGYIYVKGAGTGTDYDGTLIQLQGVTTPPDVADLVGVASNIAPTSTDDTYLTTQNMPLSIMPVDGVLFNDTDAESDPLTAALVTGPTNGTLTLNGDGSFNYTPNTDFVGSDSFTYVANDGTTDGNPATVTITIAAPPNAAPVAVDDLYSTTQDTTLNIATASGVLVNDTDTESDPLTAALVTGPTNGTLTLNTDGSFDYTPNTGFVGTDTFTYVANDGTTDGNPALVTINITSPANAAPVVGSPSLSVTEGGTIAVTQADLAVSDPDDAASSVTVTVSGVAGGWFATTAAPATPVTQFLLSDVNAGSIVFVHDGNETAPSFAVSAMDGLGASSGTPVAATVTFTAVNDAPTFIGLDATPTFTQGGSAVVLDTNASVFDAELDAIGNYGGAVLTIQRNGGASADDVFGASGTLAALANGAALTVDNTTIGTVSNTGGILTLSFDSSASVALVNSALRQITYENTATTPPASVVLDYALNDGNTGVQGTGSALTGTGSVTVAIGAPPPDLFVVATGNETFSANGGEDTLMINPPFTVDGAELVDSNSDGQFDNLVFSVFNETTQAPGTVTILNQATDPVDVALFDVDGDGVAEQYSLLANYDSGTSTFTAVPAPASALAGTVGDETLVGGAGNDVLLGNGGIDHLMGLDGDDWLSGGAGADFLDGGANGAKGDTVSYHDSLLSVTANLTAGNATVGGETDVLMGIENLEGGFLGDVLIGNSAANVLMGLEGADILQGGGGADVLIGDETDYTFADTYRYTSKTDSTAAAPDTITRYELGVDKIEFTGMAGITYDGVPYTFTTDATTTVNNIVADADVADALVYFYDGTVSYLYVKGAGTGTDFDGTLIRLEGLGTGPGITELIGVEAAPTNLAPVVVLPSLTITEGATVTVTAADLAVSDADDAASAVTVTVSGVTGGYFESTTAVGTPITSFTLAEVAGNTIRFVHDGGEAAPTFSVQATDDDSAISNGPVAATVGFTGVNDAPVVTSTLSDTVTDGGFLTFTAAQLLVTDPDNAASELTYTIGTVPTDGELRLGGVALASGQTFTQADVDGGLVSYQNTVGGTGTDSFTFTVTDGAGGSTGEQTFTFTVDAPVANTAPQALGISVAGALSFDGIDDGVLIANSTDFDGMGTAMTIEAWVRFDRDSGANQMIAAKYVTGSNERAFALEAVDAGSGFKLMANVSPDGINGGIGDLWGTTVLSIDTWYHVAMTYDGAAVKLYVNGGLDAEANYTGGIDVNTAPIGLGAMFADGSTPSYVLEGQLGDVRLWETARSLTDIQSFMNVLPDDTTGMVGYWPFTEGSGVQLTDVSGNDNHGAITGAVWIDSGPMVFLDSIATTTANVVADGVLIASDADGDSLSYFVDTDGANGTVAIDSGTGHWTYTPNTDYTGIDAFVLGANDGNGGIATYTVNIAVTAIGGELIAGDGTLADTLVGGTGDDILLGFGGDDILEGGGGADLLIGDGQGSGADTFRYTAKTDSTTAAPDTIADFQTGVDNVAFTGMAGMAYDAAPYAFTTDVTTTVSVLAGDGAVFDTVKFFTDGTDGYLYVKGSGSITPEASGDFDGTLIRLAGVTTAPTAADLVGVTPSGQNPVSVSGTQSVTLTAGVDDVITGTAGAEIITLIGAAETGDSFDGGGGGDSLALDDLGNVLAIANTATVTGGTGADSLFFDAAMLEGTSVTLNGGGTENNDVLNIAATSAVDLDATELGNITQFESFNLISDQSYTFTFAAPTIANTFNTGITINASAITAGHSLVLDASAYTGSIGLQLNQPSAGDDIVTIDVASLDNWNTTLNGGTDVNGDQLILKSAAGAKVLSGAELYNVRGFEDWVLASDESYSLTLSDANVAAGDALVIDASAVTSGINSVVVDASAETDGAVVLVGGAGNDTLTGGAGDDVLVGGAGNDFLTGGGGADILDGGLGSDDAMYSGIDTEYSVVLDGIALHITDLNVGDGDDGSDTLYKVDRLRFGGNSVDILTTTLGLGMVVTGDATGNAMIGTTANDLFVASAGTDTIVTVGGDDGLEIGGHLELENVKIADYDSDGYTDDLVFTIFDFETQTEYTTTVIDHLPGDSAGSALYQVRFEFGDDDHDLNTYRVATSFDASVETDDFAMAGSDADDVIQGGAGNDVILGNGGNDTLSGNGGDDWIMGGAGDDTINGGANGTEGDWVSYDDADAGVTVNLLAGTATSTDGGDAAGIGSDLLSGIENVEGGMFSDTLIGDTGANILIGLEGDDYITGGGGADILFGDDEDYGGGSDVFIYTALTDSGIGTGLHDIIKDFDAGTDTTAVDSIDLTAIVSGTFTFDGDAAFSADSGNTHARFDNNTKILEIDADGDATADMEIELTGVDGTHLDQNDFITNHTT